MEERRHSYSRELFDTTGYVAEYDHQVDDDEYCCADDWLEVRFLRSP